MLNKKILVIHNVDNILNNPISDFPEYHIISAKDIEEAFKILKKTNDVKLILLSDSQAKNSLKKIKKINTNSKIVVVTDNGQMGMGDDTLHYEKIDEFIDSSFGIMETKVILNTLLGENNGLIIRRIHNIDDKIKFARNLLERQYPRQLSLQTIAKKVCLNYKYLSRIFKEKTGKSYNKYRIGLKIDSAKELLEYDNFDISQIAYKLGYQNPDSFMKIFKKYTGLTPSDYRNRNKRRKNY